MSRYEVRAEDFLGGTTWLIRTDSLEEALALMSAEIKNDWRDVWVWDTEEDRAHYVETRVLN